MVDGCLHGLGEFVEILTGQVDLGRVVGAIRLEGSGGPGEATGACDAVRSFLLVTRADPHFDPRLSQSPDRLPSLPLQDIFDGRDAQESNIRLEVLLLELVARQRLL